MDIIIDTNILRQDHLLRSPKSQAIFDYLKKTNSHLIIPTVVKEEMIAQFRRELAELFEQLKSKAKKIDRWCYDDTPRTDFHLDIDREVSTYESFLNNLTQGGGALELPHQDNFLDEVIHRQINRIKPASEKGEAFRDVVIWLSIKEFLKQSKREAVFISQNTHQFAAKDSRELHPDLAAELSQEGLQLRYFCSVDDFIRQHAGKVQFITKDWVQNSLSRAQIEGIVSASIESQDRKWWRYTERKDLDWTGYIATIGFTFLDLEEFYVYELSSEDFYLHASYYGEIEVEMEFEGSYERLYRGTDVQTMTVEVYAEVGCKIHNQEVTDLNLETWDFA